MVKLTERTALLRRAKITGICLGVFLILYTVCGFIVFPAVLKSLLTSRLSEALHRKVSIQAVEMNPYWLTVKVKGFALEDRDEGATLASFDELFINLQAVSGLRLALVVDELRILNPQLRIVYHGKGRFNFSDLQAGGGEKAREESSNPLPFVLSNVEMTGGHFEFVDLALQKTHTLKHAHVTIPFLSSLDSDREVPALPSFEGILNNTKVVMRAKTKPFSDALETDALISIKGLDLPFYLPYVPLEKEIRIPSASLDTDMKVSFSMGKTKRPLLTATGTVVLQNVVIQDDQGAPLVKLPKMEIGVGPSRPLEQAIHVSRILVSAPEFHLERSKEGTLNIQTLFPGKPEGSEKKGNAGGKAPEIRVDEFRIKEGKVSFSDLSLKEPFKVACNPLDLTVSRFNTVGDEKASCELSLQTESGETIGLKGEFSIQPLQAEGRLELGQLKIGNYASYYRDLTLLDVDASGLDVHTNFRIAEGGEERQITLSNAGVALRSLKLRKRGEREDFLSLPLISVDGAEIDLTKGQATIGRFFTEKGVVQIKRRKEGDLNLLPVVPEKTAETGVAGKEGERKEAKPFQVTIKEAVVDRFDLSVEDMVPAEPVSISLKQIGLKAENLTTERGGKGTIALGFQVGPKGSFRVGGTFGIDPLKADLKVDMKGIDVRLFQPYFTDRVRITITGGEVFTSGTASVALTEQNDPTASFRGEASLTGFSCVDKHNGDDLLNWESLYLSGIDFRYNPMFIKLEEIALSNFFSYLIVNPDGTLNLQGIVVAGYKQGEGSSPSPPPLKGVRIEKVTLQGGQIRFHDKFIKPNYSANLLEIGGRVSGLASEEGEAADVHLMGKLDKFGPLEIKGKINPLREDLFVDLKIAVKDFEVSPLSPYSGKYIGYAVEKGKLHLDLKYRILGKKLDSENRIFLDQFTLGNKVESPEATKLPVGLAISLLKNRKGEIDLDLPVSGSLDDPQFSLGKVILQVLKNLIVKIVTSPFALLESLFGGGEKMSHLEFDYGISRIKEEGTRKLDSLVAALSERPGLQLEIEGHVDVLKDREGLREELFQRKIKVQKLTEMAKKGEARVLEEEIRIAPSEYPLYLKVAYRAEQFPKPRTALGLVMDLPAEEMKKLMLTYIEIREDELRLLAYQRAEKVRDYIVGSGKVDPGRVFLIEPKSLAPEAKEGVKDSRVDFRLK